MFEKKAEGQSHPMFCTPFRYLHAFLFNQFWKREDRNIWVDVNVQQPENSFYIQTPIPPLILNTAISF